MDADGEVLNRPVSLSEANLRAEIYPRPAIKEPSITYNMEKGG
jgi:hypothetical protein